MQTISLMSVCLTCGTPRAGRAWPSPALGCPCPPWTGLAWSTTLCEEEHMNTLYKVFLTYPVRDRRPRFRAGASQPVWRRPAQCRNPPRFPAADYWAVHSQHRPESPLCPGEVQGVGLGLRSRDKDLSSTECGALHPAAVAGDGRGKSGDQLRPLHRGRARASTQWPAESSLTCSR